MTAFPDLLANPGPILLCAILAYLLGSIPFGLLLTRVAGLGDIRNIGSGNIGATNVLRTGRKGLAAATLLLDGGKGAIAVLIAIQFWPDLAALAGGAAVIGHLCPVWLGFKGGKGVATTLGVLLAVAWPVGIITCLVWLAIAVIARYSSLAALAAIGSSPLTAWLLAGSGPAIMAFILAILVFWRHQANITRLWQGQESKISLGRK